MTTRGDVSIEVPRHGQVRVAVTRHRRSRTIRISVDERGDVRMSAPRHTPRAELAAALAERAGWIASHLDRAAHWHHRTVVDLAAGGPVRLLDGELGVEVVPGPRRAARVGDGLLELTVPAAADPFEVLHWWYRREARDHITARVRAWGQVVGAAPSGVSIRDQRTRWGSCSSSGRLSFSWRLVLAPTWVVDAIVVHELCHLHELNHSDRFWALVHDAYPRHDEAQQWLRDHGASLQVNRPRRAHVQPVGDTAGLPVPEPAPDAAAPGAAATQRRLFP